MKPTISLQSFDLQFKAFTEFLNEKSGVPFTSFASHPYLEDEENYKFDLHRIARKELQAGSWTEKDIGSGRIISSVIDAIELKENNIVRWQAQYGETARPHHSLYLARDDRDKSVIAETALYRLYCEADDEAVFAALIDIFGRSYAVIAYLFFIKDRTRYLPIATETFDFAFELLGAEFKTSRQCSWENYSTFTGLIDELKTLLTRALGGEVSLLDAHSFAWILARQMRRADKLAITPTGNEPSLTRNGSALDSQNLHTDNVDEASFDKWLTNIGKSPKTAKNYRRAIAGVMSDWAVKEGWIKDSLFEISSVLDLESMAKEIAKLPIYQDRNTIGKGMYAAAMKAYRDCLADVSGAIVSEDIDEIINRRDITETERASMVSTRLGQGRFRKDLIDYWDGCAVTRYKNTRLLIASHIKPWKIASHEDRVDSFNGLLLLPNLDKAFDLGFVTFEENGEILLSPDQENPQALGVKKGMKINLSDKHQENMAYHRDNIFRVNQI
jgi:hypothetical protein